MELIQFALLFSTLLCALVAGIVLTFAIVVMPGIGTMDNRDFLQAFKVMDRVIQNNQPVFMLVWLGSAVALLATTILGIWELEPSVQMLLYFACAIYILGVHVPTVTINIPLNNQLQAQDVDAMTDEEALALASKFKTRWLTWNSIRTAIAMITTVLLLVLLLTL